MLSKLSKRNLFVFAVTSVLLSAVLLLSACGAPAAPAQPAGQEVPAAAPAQQEQENVEAPAPPAEEEVDDGQVDADTEEGMEDTDTGEVLAEQDGEIEADEIEADDTDTGEITADTTTGTEGEVVAGDAPSTPLRVQLFMSQPPVVGEEAVIVMEVMTYDDAPEVTAQIELPPGVEVVSGKTSWKGSLSTGESAEVSATIVFVEPGEYGISAVALAPINADMVYGDDDAVFLTVGVDSSSFGLESGSNPQVDAGTNP